MSIAILFFLLLFPLGLIWGEKKFKVIQWISPIIICYAVGLILANVNVINIPKEIATTVSEVAVPLAIPLLLISTSILTWLKGAKGAVLSFLLCIVAVTISATMGTFLFQDQVTESWNVAGMLMGVYTGGTPNMSAIGLSLGVAEETFILLNASDLVWGAIYLLFLMTLAKPVLGSFLRKTPKANPEEESADAPRFQSLTMNQKLKNGSLFIGLSLVILAVTVGLSLALFSEMKAIFIILMVTTLGIALSFIRRLRDTLGSYEMGEYFLLVFCLALGSLADVSELMGAASQTLFFTGFVLSVAILLHYLMAYLFKIDRDTVIITSVASIYGPAFVGPIAKVLNNKSIILTGMTTGLIGYAIGNYLGIGLALLLKNWF